MARRGAKPKRLPAKKVCNTCGKVKPLRDFYLRNAAFAGTMLSHYTTECRSCGSGRVIALSRSKWLGGLSLPELGSELEKAIGLVGDIRAEIARRSATV
jgi:hypothetical protein